MKSLMFVVLLIISTTAFAYDDDPTAPFDASSVFEETMKISWKRVEKKDLLGSCNKLYAKYGLGVITYAINGCSVWVGKVCTVITAKETTMHTVGHEVRHCFQHEWHD